MSTRIAAGLGLGVVLVSGCLQGAIVGKDHSTSSNTTGSSSSTGSGGMTPSGPAPLPLSTSCQVERLASGITNASQMTATADAVYVVGGTYATSVTITRVPLSGGAATQIVSYALPSDHVVLITDVTADASNVYWSLSDGSVRRTSSDGAVEQLLVPPSKDAQGFDNYIGSLVLDGTTLFAERDETSIVSVPITGGPLTTVRQGPDTDFIGSLSLDATNFYWVNCTHNATGCSVFEAPRSGGASTDLANVRGPGIVGLRNNTLYLAGSGGFTTVSNDGVAEGQSNIFTIPLGPGQKPKTLIWGLGTPGAAVDASGEYWGVAFNDWQSGHGHFHPAPISRLSANGVLENVALDVAFGGITTCNGGICWSDVVKGTVTRAVCAAEVAPPASTTEPLAVCNDFCAAVGDCAGSSCHAVCEDLVKAPCAAEGAALTVCLKTHFDELNCSATGCDAETQALNACRGSPMLSMAPQSIGGGTGGCDSETYTNAGELWALCPLTPTGSPCTCYMNRTPVGSCNSGCDPLCCNSAFGNVAQ